MSLPLWEDLPSGRLPCQALSVECLVQNDDGGRLIHHRPKIAGLLARLMERTLCADRAQSLIDKAHRNRCDPSSKLPCPGCRILSGGGVPTSHMQR